MSREGFLGEFRQRHIGWGGGVNFCNTLVRVSLQNMYIYIYIRIENTILLGNWMVATALGSFQVDGNLTSPATAVLLSSRVGR